jgi:hypothetical protein
MFSYLKWIFLIPLIGIIYGCSDITAAPLAFQDKPMEIQGNAGASIEQVVVENNGWYFFNTIPILSGRFTRKDKSTFEWFSDEVKLEKLQQELVDRAKEKNAYCTNINISYNATCMLSMIPYVGTSLGILWYKEMQISSDLVAMPTKRQQELHEQMDILLKKIPDGGIR